MPKYRNKHSHINFRLVEKNNFMAGIEKKKKHKVVSVRYRIILCYRASMTCTKISHSLKHPVDAHAWLRSQTNVRKKKIILNFKKLS